jgi:hypothetical protein
VTRASNTIAVMLAAALAGCQSVPLQPSAYANAGYTAEFPDLTCQANHGLSPTDASLTASRMTPGAPAYIEFRARMEKLIGSGHMYVVFGRLDRAGNPVTHQYIGLFPKGGAIGMYTAMAVPIGAELKPRKEDCQGTSIGAYRVSLTEAQYQDLVGKVSGILAKPPLWHMFAYNCNHFAAQLGRVAGLTPAIDFISPTFQYIHSYIRINGDSGKGASS